MELMDSARTGARHRCASMCVTAAVVAVVAVPPALARGAAIRRPVAAACPESVPSAEVAVKLERGDLVTCRGITLDGDLVLDPGTTVAAPFRCRACRIDGRFVADDVDFAGTVDLSGTTVAGAVSLSRARFEGDTLFEPVAARATVFEDVVDLSRARFARGASFTGATFSDRAGFASARFLDDASFADARFGAGAEFAATVFEGAVSFRSTARQAFDRYADFTSARFGERADFRRRVFRGKVDFSEAEFRDVVDLSRTTFSSRAWFTETRFEGDASFFTSTFRREARFDDAVASAMLDFRGAHFAGPASFLAFESTGAFAIDGDKLLGDLVVSDHTSIDDLRLVDFAGVVAALDRYGDREYVEHFLGVIEAAAKTRNDLKLANDARYERRKLHAEGYGRARRLRRLRLLPGRVGVPRAAVASVRDARPAGVRRRSQRGDRIPNACPSFCGASGCRNGYGPYAEERRRCSGSSRTRSPGSHSLLRTARTTGMPPPVGGTG